MVILENIVAAAGNFRLKNISMKIEKGQFNVLLGPTGSGKTLLLEVIAGLQKISSGTVMLHGKNANDLPPEERHLSYLAQDNALFPHLNVFRNISFGLELRKEKFTHEQIRSKIEEIANTLDIAHLMERTIDKLSGGERQRVALARALVLENSLFLLDEPTSSLHEAMQEEFFLMIKEIAEKFNLTIILATHHRDSAFLLADTLHFIFQGALVMSTDTKRIFEVPLPYIVANYLGIDNLIPVNQKIDGKGKHGFECEVLKASFDFPSFRNIQKPEFTIGIRPVDIRVVKDEDLPTADNTFQVLVKKTLHKLNDAIVLLQHPETGFKLKMQISIYNQEKLKILPGTIITCTIKEPFIREIIFEE